MFKLLNCVRNLDVFLILVPMVCLFLCPIEVWAELLNGRPIRTGEWMGKEVEYLGGQIIVKIRPGADSAQTDSLFNINEVFVIHYFNERRWGLLGCDTSANVFEKIESLMTSSLIEWAEPNGVVRPASAPNDPKFQDSTQWALWDVKGTVVDADIDALEAWSLEKGDSNLIIAIVDCGFPYDTVSGWYCHGDLSDPYKYILGYNCVYANESTGCVSAEEASLLDSWPHGTQVTGIISAMTDNNRGIAGIVWFCRIFIIKAYSPSGTVWNTSVALDSAVSFGADIINLSAGHYGGPYYNLEEAVYNADTSNCLIIASGGNVYKPGLAYPAGFATHGFYDTLGHNCCNPDTCPNYPHSCGYRNVIAVTATYSSDSWVGNVSYSDSLTKITVAAPSGVYTTFPLLNQLPDSCEGYAYFGNTSSATPHVTGVAGLLQSHAIKRGARITPDSIRALIEFTADDIESPGWDTLTGFGRVNAFKALMAMEGYYPDATGYLRINTTWGDTLGDTIYVLGDVVVPASCTLTINQGAVVKFLANDGENWGVDSTKCEIIVKGRLVAKGTPTDSVHFLTASDAPSDSDWYGVKVELSGGASFNYCDFRNAYTAIYDGGSAYDSVTHCRFKNNFMHAIKTRNSNLLVDNCVIENDSIGGSDTTYYGILCDKSSPTIKNTLMKNCKYGIKATTQTKFLPTTPVIEECGFYNIGTTGIWAASSSKPTIKKCCFKGNVGLACIQVDGGNPYIEKCYMASEGDGILIGMLFENSAKGKIRRATIWDYDSCAVEIVGSTTNPDFGTSDSAGNNQFERTDNYYFVSTSSYTINAELNYWGIENSDSIGAKIYGDVDFSPFYNQCGVPVPYYPDICSDLPPDDPTISPCKIVATSEEKMPKTFAVSQNYPNPFNPQTVIKYDLPKPGHVNITIYNILGREVRALVDEEQEAGYKSVGWDGKDDLGKDVASGIYFYRIKAGDFSMTKKMVLLR